MNRALVDKIVAALLYEGYILYPYRPSVKNRQRWTFGGLYPPSYCQAEGGSESSIMQTQCLVVGDNRTRLDVNVRCLHLVERTVGEPVAPLSRLPEDKEPPLKIVAELQVGEKILQSWQEAMQEEIPVSACELGMLSEPLSKAFRLPGFRKFEGVAGPGGDIAAVIVRQQQPVEGCVELSALQLTEELFRVSIRISNQTPLHEGTSHTRDQALMHALVSTHTILSVREGEFVSLTDPQDRYRHYAATCHNIGAWPVLVGAEGEKDTMLSSPIILYDYPQVAPESPGDLFDCTEIDEILSLRILTLTEEEKRQAGAVDERARKLLERTESLAREQLLGLHGTIRGLRPVPEGTRHD